MTISEDMKTFLDHFTVACVQCLGSATDNQRYEIAVIP